MYGFERAQAEYESHLMAPYDEGGALYDEEEELRQREDYLETQAEYEMDEMMCERQAELDEQMLWNL